VLELRQHPWAERALRVSLSGISLAAVLSLALATLCRRFTYNTTSSLPRGFYLLRRDRSPARHDIVAFAIPESLVPMVSARGYLPLSYRLLKQLVAVPGDHVCLDEDSFVVNGTLVSRVTHLDSLGRPLPPAFPYCDTVPQGVGFVATAATTSLDSRFFGPVPLGQLTVAQPIWTQSSL
jgi:conjugative transfer signal peptidase TraF